MSDLKKIPIGIDDFKKIRDEGYYYVDKTDAICLFVEKGMYANMVTRPGCFGKTTFLSMFDAFFNMKYEGNTWFDGLKVNEKPYCLKEKNKLPVIKIDMKDLPVDSFESFRSAFQRKIIAVIDEFPELYTSDKLSEWGKELLTELTQSDVKDSWLTYSIKTLSKLLKDCYGRSSMILIDEYDAPINNSYGKDTYKKIQPFMEHVYSSALKDNENMDSAILTGLMRVAKISFGHSINNFNTQTIFGWEFDCDFGFTEPEVKDLLSYYGHPEKYDEAKEWYGEYVVDEIKVFNPYSLLKYVDNGFKPGVYRTETGGRYLLELIVPVMSEYERSDIESMINGETISDHIDDITTYDSIHRDAITIMVMSGYLRTIYKRDDAPWYDEHYWTIIPNKEAMLQTKALLDLPTKSPEQLEKWCAENVDRSIRI